jgi:hypothetical protein
MPDAPPLDYYSAMNKADVKECIFKELEPRIHDASFRVKKSEGAFVRVTPIGKQVIGIPLIDYNPDFKFSLNISVRIEAVESLIHQFLGSPQKYQKLSYTYSTPLARFVSPEDGWFVVSSPEEIARAAVRLEPIVAEKIIPFLDSHDNVSALAEVMNLTHIPEKLPGPGPAMYAVTVARLAKRPEFEKMVVDCEPRVARLHPAMQDIFRNLVAYLRKLP